MTVLAAVLLSSRVSRHSQAVLVAGGELCVHRLAPNMLKVLTGQDSPHFNFDAVIDMGVQQEGVFASKLIVRHKKQCALLAMTIVNL